MCLILLARVQIWHFYCTLFRGLLFFRTQCREVGPGVVMGSLRQKHNVVDGRYRSTPSN